jgi:PAS domain S-box-containing protein
MTEENSGLFRRGGAQSTTALPQLWQYGVALLSVALALGTNLLFESYLGPTPTPVFFAAVMVSTWYGGFGPGLLASVLSTLAVNYFYIEPFGSFHITDLGGLTRMGVFVMAVALINSLNQAQRSAQQRAEANLQALRRSEAQFGGLAKSGIIGTIVADLDGSIVDANDAFLQMVGYTRDDLCLGRIRWQEMTPPDYLDVSQRSQEELRTTGVCTPFEKEYIRQDGSRVPILLGSAMLEENTVIGFVLDITERKRAEAALRTSEERYRLLVETTTTLVWTANSEGEFVCAQPSWEDYTGQGWEEHAGWGWLEMFHPDDREELKARWDHALTEQSYYEAEGRLWHAPSQHYRHIVACAVPLLNADGSVREWIGMDTDIHDRKQAEAALRQSDRHFKSVFNQQFQYMAILTPEGRIIDVNDSPLKATGVNREDVLGQLFWETLWWTPLPDMQAVWVTQIAEVAQGSAPITGETYYATADGTLRFSQYALTAVKDEAGQVVNLIVQASDLSDRKRFENTLHRLIECARLRGEPFFKALVRALAEALDVRYAFICQVHPDNPQQARTIAGWANGAWVENFDYSLSGAPCEQVVQNQTCFYRSSVTQLFPQDQFLIDMGIESYLGAPLQAADGRILGLLNALHDRPIDETCQPEALIQIFADQAAAELERQQADEAIRVSEERLRSFVEANVVGILFGDIYGGIHQANDELLRIVGYTRDDLQTGRLRWIDITPPEFLPIDQQHIVEAQATGACTPYEKEYIRKDGSRVPVLVGYSLVGDAREESTAVILDLSDRQQAEVTLRQSEERYRYLVESIPQLVWTADADGQIIDANQRWLDYTGFTLAQIQATGWQAIVHTDDIPTLSQQWVAAQQAGVLYRAEGRMRRTDGAYRWHLHEAIPVKNQQGQVVKWFGTATDIEDQKQLEHRRQRLLEQEQAAREQAETANRIKDEFLAVLSHELRSPLNPILGWSKLLQTQKLDEQQTRRALATIEQNAKLQTQLIEDLLDISRILRGKLVLNIAPVSLISTIEAALETVRLAIEAKGIQIQRGFNLDVDQVMGDAARLQQLIWNLLSNAVKFTPSGGMVEIRAERIDTHIQIQVRDTGKGIKPAFLPYVFDYFRQEDGTTTRKFGGLGLGLAIVRHITELHGGTVWAESPGEGMGATFTVCLPLWQDEADRMKAVGELDLSLISHPSSFPLAGLRVLAVDDNADIRDLIEFVLQQAGAEVRVISSAAEVLQQLQEFSPEVLISDVGMPDLDGYMLLRQIRSLPPEQGGTILAIALTAYAGEINQQQAIAAGFQMHLAKPVEPENLVNAIVTLLDDNQANEY